MSVSRLVWSVVFMALSVSVFGQTTSLSQDPIVAEIGTQKLTLTELEQSMAPKLFQARQQYYQAQQAALQQWIDDQVLSNEARRQNLTVEQLLERTIHVSDPTEDQMRVYAEGLNTDQPYEAVREKVLEHIRELRIAKIRAAYMKSLREQAGVRVMFAPPTASFAMSETPVLGTTNAPIQLVEFGDYECPYCQQAYPVLKQLLDKYGPKVSFSFRDYPLPMHPEAPKAAEAARCAGAQGKYWEFYNALFSIKKLGIADLKAEAGKLALDSAAFDKCLDSGEKSAAVEKDTKEAQHLQLTGTPTFFINGHLYAGASTFEDFRTAIEHELSFGSAAGSTAKIPASASQ
jgi:protein-disulfide isomerase